MQIFPFTETALDDCQKPFEVACALHAGFYSTPGEPWKDFQFKSRNLNMRTNGKHADNWK